MATKITPKKEQEEQVLITRVFISTSFLPWIAQK
jgi:hypothetical protein